MLMLANEFDAALRSSTTQNMAKSLSLIGYTWCRGYDKIGGFAPHTSPVNPSMVMNVL